VSARGRTRPSAPPDQVSARGLRVAVVRSRYNSEVVDGLLAGAREALRESGAADRDVVLTDVPGAFELPLAAAAAARSGRFDAIVALGAVIKGETDHYEHIAREAAHGLAEVARETGVPVGFGVLTVDREEQALARSAPGPDNKGAEAARAAVAMVHVLRGLRRKAR
jgi:6,7-dimethyl-8-ribityllumazine synthase